MAIPPWASIAPFGLAHSDLQDTMPALHFITHPEVVIDPSIPVRDWQLSSEGLRRIAIALERPWTSGLGSVFSSDERKAADAARMVGVRFGLSPRVIAELGENDRSATGYLPRAEFEATADLFFAQPNESVRGWERAVDAQRRIMTAIERVIAEAPRRGDVAVIAHGGVGALLLCHLKGVPISRAEDQPGAAGGCIYSFDIATRALLSGWHAIEDQR